MHQEINYFILVYYIHLRATNNKGPSIENLMDYSELL